MLALGFAWNMDVQQLLNLAGNARPNLALPWIRRFAVPRRIDRNHGRQQSVNLREQAKQAQVTFLNRTRALRGDDYIELQKKTPSAVVRGKLGATNTD